MDENQEKEVMDEKKETIETETTNENKKTEEANQNQEPETTSEKQEEVSEIQDSEVVNVDAITDEAELKSKKGSYITGTIGAILGGLIASIPWILTYTYANMIVAVLATLIAGGAFLGYKIFRGKIGKGLPAIITIVSLLVVTVVTTVICPVILMAQSGYPITFNNLKGLYSDVRADVRTAIFEDLAISLLFTVIGIAAVVHSISVQIKNGATRGKIKFNTQAVYDEVKKELEEQNEIVKKACTALNSINKESAITKQELLNELEMTYNVERKKAKQCFATCVSYKLLKKHKGKYYYDEENAKTNLENIKTSNHSAPKTTMVIILTAIIIGVVAGYVATNLKTTYTIPDTNIKLEIDDTQAIYGTEEEITEAFGEEFAEYYDFIVKDIGTDKYDLYGMLFQKSGFEGYDFETILKVYRDYYASVIGEDSTTEVTDKDIEGKSIKSYSYTYTGNDENTYRAVTYVYDVDEYYLWIDIYADLDLELTQIDTIIEKLLK